MAGNNNDKNSDISIGGDGTPCPICNKPIPKESWRGIENVRLACCGKLICYCLTNTASESKTKDQKGGKWTTTGLIPPPDLDNCPLCHEKNLKYPSQQYRERIQKHVRDGKAWAQYLESCILAEDPNASASDNYSDAFRLATLSAEQGYTPAYWLLGYMYEEGMITTGTTTPAGEEKALFWYEKSAKAGNAKAQNKVGHIYSIMQKGNSNNNKLAVDWYVKSANQGYPLSQLELAFCYLEGKNGVKQPSKEQAMFWFQKAATHADTHTCTENVDFIVQQAHFMIGLLLYQEGDYIKSIPHFQKADPEQANDFLNNISEAFGGMPPDAIASLAAGVGVPSSSSSSSSTPVVRQQEEEANRNTKQQRASSKKHNNTGKTVKERAEEVAFQETLAQDFMRAMRIDNDHVACNKYRADLAAGDIKKYSPMSGGCGSLEDKLNSPITPRKDYCRFCDKKQGSSGAGAGAEDGGKLLRCSRCKAVWYCNKECQKKDWKFHKKGCDLILSDPKGLGDKMIKS